MEAQNAHIICTKSQLIASDSSPHLLHTEFLLFQDGVHTLFSDQ